MNNKIIFYSDVHLRDKGSFIPYNRIESNGYTKEINNILRGFKFIANKILELKPSAVIFCGDMYHQTESIPTTCLDAAHKGLSLISSACLEVGAIHYLIPGQHDIIDEINMTTSISNLIGYGIIILQPKVIKVGDLKIKLVPYTSNTGKLYTELIGACTGECNLVVTHADFQGCMYESNTPSKSILSPTLPITCISGDIHKPQDVESVKYVGSLVQNKFFTNNIDNVGGIIEYNCDPTNGKEEIIRHPNTFSKHYVKVQPFNKDDVTYLSNAIKLDPDKVVLTIYSYEEKSEIDNLFNKYEYYYFPISKSEDTNFEAKMELMENPETLLREHVKNENPNAIDTLEELLKK